MAPNLEENKTNPSLLGPVFFLSPLTNPVLDHDDIIQTVLLSSDSDSELDQLEILLEETTNRIPLLIQNSLRDLLVKVTATEDLDTVTQVKLRVIARDLTLQQLSIYTPALRELILDGSVVSTLRDLGCGLKNLKILRVNRCGLTCLDGMSSLESLEELYATDNLIENLVPCAFLPYIRVIDLKRNYLKDIQTLTFLTLCEQLEHLCLEENDEISQFSRYRQQVKSLLPSLKTLDGIKFTEEECNTENFELMETELTKYLTENADRTINNTTLPSRPRPASSDGINLSRNRPNTAVRDKPSSFIIRFPPKIFLDRPSSNSSSCSSWDSKSERCNDLHDAEAFPSIFNEGEASETDDEME